ncbi:sulfur carrier protein ThiS [Macrococcus equipercicus]|uniref:Sulfur carrier protein ThiS n=1 Tax=Macrococcus equipercicus TaxID=69967 RepID=A0ABQ6R6I7_9STAP|nr:sulfur carrier protein ThiS [Macrococcus equipercicus]KAA1036903.1 sulfur carrier protein ThiS [Macrococcus equipercicus]
MTLTVNGEQYTTAAATIRALLDELDVDDDRVIVLLNDVPVAQKLWLTAELAAADRLELLEFVGGG